MIDDISHRRAGIAVVFCGLMITVSQAHAQEQSFSDVPSSHFAFQAVEFLKENGVLSGYPDGTFQPDKTVNRAEATKIVVAPLLNPDVDLTGFTSVYDDVSNNDWYMPYVEIARSKLGIVDGPPKTTVFNGGRPVNKVEFLKILLLAQGEKPTEMYSEITMPLSLDVTNPDEWYYPYMRSALAASMTMVGEDGFLHPAKPLSRGEVAVLLHRYLMYKQGRRTQALLSETESEIINTVRLMEDKDINNASFAAGRAVVVSRGALTSRPDESIVKGAVKTAEGFHKLTQGYVAGLAGQFDTAIALAQEAWGLAERAKEFSPELNTLAAQMQEMASTMAGSLRAQKEKVQ